jgi:Zn-finger protein
MFLPRQEAAHQFQIMNASSNGQAVQILTTDTMCLCPRLPRGECNKGAAEVRLVFSASIHNCADCLWNRVVSQNNIDGLLDTPTARHDVFRNDEALALFNLKTTAQSQTAGFFSDENVTFPKRACNLLADNNSPERRRNNGVALELPQLFG